MESLRKKNVFFYLSKVTLKTLILLLKVAIFIYKFETVSRLKNSSVIYSKGPDRDKKLIIDKSFSIDLCDCNFNCKTTYADDSVLFNTF